MNIGSEVNGMPSGDTDRSRSQTKETKKRSSKERTGPTKGVDANQEAVFELTVTHLVLDDLLGQVCMFSHHTASDSTARNCTPAPVWGACGVSNRLLHRFLSSRHRIP